MEVRTVRFLILFAIMHRENGFALNLDMFLLFSS